MTRRRQSIVLGLGAAGGMAGISALRRLRASKADAAFFAGKHVIVTGGSRGLGLVLTELMLEAGAAVSLCGRSQHAIGCALERLERFAPAVHGSVCDVRERAQCERFIRNAQARFGPPDVLVNNAGIIEAGPFADQTIADFEAALETHFWAPLYTTLAVLPTMRARRGGHIVNVASIGGIVGVPHFAPYSASKFAQVGLTQALAAELAADGIRMTSIVPGLMLTGSPDHPLFKRRQRAEYAWFPLSDANPLLAVSARSAAKRIMRATRRGEAQAVIGTTAQIAKIVNALFPETTAAALRLAAALLPSPGGVQWQSRTRVQSRSRWTRSTLTEGPPG
jgi:NAD(P)-dependent dehydrogenase (short-subunit alcohol dehydrogenase family)